MDTASTRSLVTTNCHESCSNTQWEFWDWDATSSDYAAPVAPPISHATHLSHATHASIEWKELTATTTASSSSSSPLSPMFELPLKQVERARSTTLTSSFSKDDFCLNPFMFVKDIYHSDDDDRGDDCGYDGYDGYAGYDDKDYGIDDDSDDEDGMFAHYAPHIKETPKSNPRPVPAAGDETKTKKKMKKRGNNPNRRYTVASENPVWVNKRKILGHPQLQPFHQPNNTPQKIPIPLPVSSPMLVSSPILSPMHSNIITKLCDSPPSATAMAIPLSSSHESLGQIQQRKLSSSPPLSASPSSPLEMPRYARARAA